MSVEIVGMLAGGLESDYGWNDRVSLVSNSTYAFLDRGASAGLPNVIWIKAIKTGDFPIRDVVDRANTLQSAPINDLYARVDLNHKNRVCFAYGNNQGAFVLAGEGQAGQGGQPVLYS